MLSGFGLHPRIADSEASVPVELMIKSARKLVVEPPMTVGLCPVQLRALFFHVALYISNAHSSQKKTVLFPSL